MAVWNRRLILTDVGSEQTFWEVGLELLVIVESLVAVAVLSLDFFPSSRPRRLASALTTLRPMSARVGIRLR